MIKVDFHIDKPKAEEKKVVEDIDKLCLIVVHYGGSNALRKKAIMSAVFDWERQEEKPDDAIFLELVCPNEEPCFDQNVLPRWIRYIRIYGKERNKNLFQKEAMWNLATKYTDAGKYLFLDSDVSPVDTLHYFRDMKAAIKKGIVIHACDKLIQERYEDKYLGEMYSILAKKEQPKGHYLFPRNRIWNDEKRFPRARRLPAVQHTWQWRRHLRMGDIPRHQAANRQRETFSSISY